MIADAVRFGSGTDSTSGLPRWQMSAQDFLTFQGQTGVTDDIDCRPAVGNLLSATGAVNASNAVYVSLQVDSSTTTTLTGVHSFYYGNVNLLPLLNPLYP